MIQKAMFRPWKALVLGAALSVLAQGADREADHAALRALRARVVAAINQRDIPALRACFARDFVFTTVNQRTLTSQAEVDAFFQATFQGPGALVKGMTTDPSADILTRFLGEDVGLCYGGTKETYVLVGGKTVAMDGRWTATVVREEGQWKVASAHVGTDFLKSPLLEAANAFWKKALLGAALGTLVLGFLLGRTIGRRR